MTTKAHGRADASSTDAFDKEALGMPQTLSGATPLTRGRATAITITLVAGLLGLGLAQAPAAHAFVVVKAAPVVVPWDGGITISGVGLTGTSSVTFLGEAGTPADDVDAEHFIALDDKKLVVQVPPGAQTGRVEMVTPSGPMATDLLKGDVKVVHAPVITSLSATSGKPGDLLTITGQNLLGSKKPKVLIGVKGGAMAADPVPSQTQIVVKVPAGNAGGPVALQVITDGGTAQGGFYIAPEIKGAAPKAGSTAGGTVVTIAGSGFTGVDNFTDNPGTPAVNERFDGVKIGGVRVTDLVAVNDKEIVAVAPVNSEGLADVEVSTKAGAVTATTALADAYDFQPIPVITAVSQNWNEIDPGAPEAVTLTGVNFTESSELFVGSVKDTARVVDTGAGTITFTPAASVKAAVTKVTVTNTSAAAKAFSAVVPFGYVGAPTVTKLDKVAGPVGTVVNIAGTGFGSGTTATFGAAAATCTIVSFVALRCTAPAGTGAVNVTVDNGVGTASAVTPFTYNSDPLPPAAGPAMPAVAALLPAYGTVGSTVAFKGANLQTVTGVKFSGDSGWVDAPNALIVGPARLVVTVPAGAITGPIRLTTANGPVSTAPKVFTYSGKPSITEIDVVGEATYGATAGDMIKITGTGLFPAGVRPVVTIGGKVAAVLPRPAPTQRTIVVRVPGSVGGRESLVLTTPLGSDTADNTVYFLPQVKGAKPVTTANAGGTVVTVAGSGFTGVENVAGRVSAVKFGGVPVSSFVKMSDKMLVGVTAPGSASADELVIKTAHDGLVGLSNDTVRYAVPPQPTLGTVEPNSALVGSVPPAVTITGTNLNLSPVVRFGGVAGTVQSAAGDGTSLIVVPPVGAAAVAVGVSVTTTDDGTELSANLPNAYTYLPAPPTVTGMSAGTAVPGTPVAITGINFVGVTSVRFGAVEVDSFTVGNANTIFTTVPLTPSGAGGNATAVTVTNTTGGDSTAAPAAADDWTWDSRPIITGMSASTGAAGSTVTITGRNLSGVTAVRFGPASGTAVTVINDTSLTVAVPVTPSVGATADVVLMAGSVESVPPLVASANDWTWYGRPRITTMSASTGAPGSTVTITGINFTGVTEVRFGPVAGTSLTVVNDTSLTVTVPATPDVGTTVDVVPMKGSVYAAPPLVTSADDWTWAGRPRITSMSASTLVEGSTLTINGSNFTGVTQVRFGSAYVAPLSIAPGGTSLTVTVPVTPSAGTVVDVVLVAGSVYSAPPAVASADDWTWAPIANITGISIAGSTMTITGTNLTAARTVLLDNGTTFSTVNAPFTTNTATSLSFTLPASPPGNMKNGRAASVINGSGAQSTATARANYFNWP